MSNRLLAGLSAEELAALEPHLEPIDLTFRQTLFEPETPIREVIFVDQGVASILSSQSGSPIEVATVGNEGMIGLPVFLGSRTVPLTAIVQVAGRGRRMSAAELQAATAIPASGLHRILSRYTQALLFQIAQSAACRSVHVAEQRAARWLLMTHDRVDGDRFPLTQEFLARMLGVRRATVTETQVLLKRRRVIDYVHGEIEILDRAGLEAVACDCYRLIEAEFERLLPAPGGAATPGGRPSAVAAR